MSTSIAPKRSASPLEDDRPTKAARPPWQELPNTGKADRQLTDSEYQNLKSSLDTERYNVFIFEAAHICMANGSTGKSVVVSQIVSAMGKWLSLLDTKAANYERTVVYLQQWTSKPRNTQENYFIEKGKTRGKGKGEQKKNGSKATERTMIRNRREYISLAEVRAGDSPIRRSSRSAHQEHPRYCIFVYGLSVYRNVDVDKYRSLLQVTDFFADHPREQTMKEVYAMKPFWTAGSSFGFVDMNESFLTTGIDDEHRVDGVHAQTDTSDDEMDEDEMDEDEAGEDETGEDGWDKD
ncbi:uncharacterized protein C8R40DRAFT_1068917 [Lentinula edodes]|uniref:uncharacterized protein n=1 Tax=Lentinula edodes TaxID=5353 RepID=UPI001E8CF9D2|nr:uncharacterized protein C8R40DRAFT_1068917 [Lentinula edodes]KAH7876125.1 hypothetical protein C8R40DRAFT_1068917 [Lentinula edodes]